MIIILLTIGFLSCFFIAFIFSLMKAGRRADKAEENLISLLFLSDPLDNTKTISDDKKVELETEKSLISSIL